MASSDRNTSIRRALAALALWALGALPAVAAATDLVVDLDGQASAADCNAPGIAYTSIQAAVNAAVTGDTIVVCPGTYDEQLTVSKDGLRIRGSGSSVTRVKPSNPHALTTSLLTGLEVTALLLVDGAGGVAVEGLRLDGSGLASAAGTLNCGSSMHFIGVYARNASVNVASTHVTGVRSASSCAYAVRAESGGGGASQLALVTSMLDHYGDVGVMCIGPATSCTISGSTVRGDGAVGELFQTGIFVNLGAAAKIAGNTITDHRYGPKFRGIAGKAVGIFLFTADPASNPFLLRDNVFANNELNVQRAKTSELVN